MVSTDARLTSIRLRMKRPSLLRIWREIDGTTKEKVFALLEDRLFRVGMAPHHRLPSLGGPPANVRAAVV